MGKHLKKCPKEKNPVSLKVGSSDPVRLRARLANSSESKYRRPTPALALSDCSVPWTKKHLNLNGYARWMDQWKTSIE